MAKRQKGKIFYILFLRALKNFFQLRNENFSFLPFCWCRKAPSLPALSVRLRGPDFVKNFSEGAG